MKKNIGNVLALYPTPAVVVGTEVNGKVNWLLVAHVGIIGHDQIMLSMFKKHYTNEGCWNEPTMWAAQAERRQTSRMYSSITGAKLERPSSTKAR